MYQDFIVGVTDEDIKPLLFMCKHISEILPSFDRSNGWTTIIFKILFTAKGRWVLRE
jgi:hypothetical protein